jgi:hypothetical protein
MFSRSRAKTMAQSAGGADRLADCEEIFRAQKNKRMKDKAAHACHALCSARVLSDYSPSVSLRSAWNNYPDGKTVKGYWGKRLIAIAAAVPLERQAEQR